MSALDNVIFHALSTRQAEFAVACDEARRFMPEVSSLGAFLEPSARGYESLRGLVAAGETIGLSLAEPYRERPGWSLVVGCAMPQMVYAGDGGLMPGRADGSEMAELGPADVPAMMELTALTKPGPFHPRTHELGTYLGIYVDGRLVAMAGERMKVPGYTEVSAVCTHPEYAGRGYARRLMTEVMRGILERGETPFLHVRGENVRAIEFYERLGFRERVVSWLAVLRRD